MMPSRVTKRDGSAAAFDAEEIRRRVVELSDRLCISDLPSLVSSVVCSLPEGVRTSDIDNELAEQIAYRSIAEPDMGVLAGRVLLSNLRKRTCATFSGAMQDMFRRGIVCREVNDFVQSRAEEWDALVDQSRDEEFDFFAMRTLLKSYLICDSDRAPLERPQYMFLRVAISIHCVGDAEPDVRSAKMQYELTSRKFYTHASPTLYNAGTARQQMSSCFLLTVKEDSLEGIFKTLTSCAKISKHAGGLGLSISHLRAKGSRVGAAGGRASGTIAAMRLFNDMITMVDQGNGKRKGGIAIYMEPWHADIFDFVSTRRAIGREETLCRDIFTALWIPDLFMKRVEANEDWALFCPLDAPGLVDAHGAAFEALYLAYEREGRQRRVVKARELMDHICTCQCESGVPYVLFKDAANAKSNQKHLGCIRSSNLCTEIIEYTSADETAVCNLASICLNKFDASQRPMEQILDAARIAGVSLDDETRGMCAEGVGQPGACYQSLFIVSRFVCRALDRVIERNWYPTSAARRSNMAHRPIGMGVQGMADLFAQLRLPFESEAAYNMNRDLFKTMYAGAVLESARAASLRGPHPSFPGSPASMGLLQPHLWGVRPEEGEFASHGGRMFDWDAISAAAAAGMRNSLLIAPMPTASTSQIMGNNECFEPFTSNLYTRSTTAGNFIVINKHMVQSLKDIGMWNADVVEAIKHQRGSIQAIPSIPRDVRDVFKTVWEIRQRRVIEMARIRGPFICQSQSLNIHIADPDNSKMKSLHLFAWKCGLKTGMYYLRRLTAATAVAFTVDERKAERVLAAPAAAAAAAECESCSA
jgi:ribonucleoside-diphosphate reductase alpha chain